MSSPSSTLVTLRPDLGASLEEFDLEMDRMGFIAHRVLPVLEVVQQSDTFGKIPLEALLQDPDNIDRNSKSGYARGDYEFEDDNYVTKERGFEVPVDERDERIYRNYFDAEAIAAGLARDVVLRQAEKRAAALLFNPVTWTGSALTTGINNEWDLNHVSDAQPTIDVEAAVNKVYDGTGLWPNALIINRKVFRNLRLLDDIIEKLHSQGAGKSIEAGNITVEHLSQVFDLPYIIVAGSSKNTANEGQSATPSQIWSSEYAMVARIAETDSIKEPCLGRTFHWAADGSQIGATMEDYEEPQARGHVIRARHEVQEKVLMVQCGHLLSNVTTL